MEIRITLFIILLLYSVAASQHFFYLPSMGNAGRNMEDTTYIESRKLLDHRLSKTLTGAYDSTLPASIALNAFCVTNPSGLLIICSIVSPVSLPAGIVLRVKGNAPLNEIINIRTVSNYPDNWYSYRTNGCEDNEEEDPGEAGRRSLLKEATNVLHKSIRLFTFYEEENPGRYSPGILRGDRAGCV
jgi:hypothetical protein